MYVLDHREVSLQIMRDKKLRKRFWRSWMDLIKPMNQMNSYYRRSEMQEHVQYPSDGFRHTLLLQIDLSNHMMLFYYNTMTNLLVSMTHPPV